MNIALIGYGKMGREIETVAQERGHSISHRVSSKNSEEIHTLNATDVAIEFTSPDAALNNFAAILKQNIPLVTGTTGWHDAFERVRELVKPENRFFYASNFSIGVNIAFAVNEYLAKFMAGRPAYEARIHEVHHSQKKDAPSGTAISLAKGITDNASRYTGWIATDDSRNSKTAGPSTIKISSERTGSVPGTHEIWYESPEDSLLLKHIAKGRRGFAVGAVMAAEFLVLSEAGIYTMKDLLKFSLT